MDRSFHIDINRDEIVSRLREHGADLRNLGVTAISIFGSRARGDHRPDSDLDLLIDYDTGRKFSLVDLVHVEHYIEDLVGCPVQITTHSSVPAADRSRIDAEAINRVATYTTGKSMTDLAGQPMLNDAIERCIERVSEASRHIPDEVKDEHPTVPWQDIASIGNRIRHGYFAIDPRIIWDTATLDLPALLQTMLEIQRRLPADPARREPEDGGRGGH